MANIKQNPTYRAQNKYYGHDLSQHLEFTSTTGQLVPVFYDVLNPGEKITARTYMKTRTQPLAAASMIKMNEYLEWYFVPMTQIYKPFSNWFYGIQDFGSSLFVKDNNINTRMSQKFPYITSLGLRDFRREMEGSETTLMGEDFYNSFVRLASHLGIDDVSLLENSEQFNSVCFSITPLLFAAYQKIWMDHYRLSDRIDNDPRSFNLDSFFDKDTPMDGQDSATVEVLKQIFQLRYRPLRKDFFTNNFPSPLFGAGSVGAQWFLSQGLLSDSTLEKVNQWLTDLNRISVNDPQGQEQNFTPTNASLPHQLNEQMAVHQMNQANIKTLFAADKLLEITRRSGKHYDAQTLAHFGVSVPDNIEGQSYYLGRSVQELVVGDVVSTSNTDNEDPASPIGSPLGEIAGKGYSVGRGDDIKFEAPCHGVLMCLYSSAPVVDYYEEGLDKLNCLIEKSDFFVPEYDNLGMQPLFGYQCKIQPNLAQNSAIRGWQYRYYEFKQKYNRIIAGLKHTQKHWTVGKSTDAAGYSAADYYVSPNALGNAMLYQYNYGFDSAGSAFSFASQIFESDPLIHEIAFDVKKASQMTTYGLMEL